MECEERCVRMRAEPEARTSNEIENDTEEMQIAAAMALAAAGKTVRFDFSVKASILIWERASTQRYDSQPDLH